MPNMRIHREGRWILLALALALALVNLAVLKLVPTVLPFTSIVSVVLFLFTLYFFRHPPRTIEIKDENIVYAPADGRVVVIEEVEENEYFHAKRLQVSIFMSPANVHVNRNPVSGQVRYVKYHPGKYLVAWHPKSSVENERATMVIDNGRAEILLRQIAGALARRIRTYLSEGDHVEQGDELGFIKFGSRVDVLLPLDAKVEVDIGQKVKGNLTVIARLG